jgi:hypothetical protein
MFTDSTIPTSSPTTTLGNGDRIWYDDDLTIFTNREFHFGYLVYFIVYNNGTTARYINNASGTTIATYSNLSDIVNAIEILKSEMAV